MNTKKIQVFIISQQFLFRLGLEHVLARIKDVEISGSAEINSKVISVIDAAVPDVALVDIDTNSNDGLELAHRIKQRSSNIGVIMLTSERDDAHLFEILKAQAAACLSKDVTTDELVDTIRRVAHGEHPINESLSNRPKVAEKVLHQFQKLSRQIETEAFIAPLSPRETEILDYIAQGYQNKRIAHKLNISEQTIKNHVTSILRKLNANARTEAVVIAIKEGLIPLNYKVGTMGYFSTS